MTENIRVAVRVRPPSSDAVPAWLVKEDCLMARYDLFSKGKGLA